MRDLRLCPTPTYKDTMTEFDASAFKTATLCTIALVCHKIYQDFRRPTYSGAELRMSQASTNTCAVTPAVAAGLARRAFLVGLAVTAPDQGSNCLYGGLCSAKGLSERNRRSLCRAHEAHGTFKDTQRPIQSCRGQHAVVGAAWSKVCPERRTMDWRKGRLAWLSTTASFHRVRAYGLTSGYLLMKSAMTLRSIPRQREWALLKPASDIEVGCET